MSGKKFNYETHLGSDVVMDRTRMSMYPGNYALDDIHKNTNSNFSQVQQLAAANVGFNATDGRGVDPDYINYDSKFKYSHISNLGTVNQLFPRSIGTVPKQTKKMCLNADTLIKSPEYSDNTKTAKTVSDIDYNRFTPLVQNLRQTVQNPHYLIPENSLPYWKQGGISTRNLVQNTDYIKRLQRYRGVC